MTDRRKFLLNSFGAAVGGAVIGVGMTACGSSDAASGSSQTVSYLVVHGAWHTSLCWNRVIAGLAEGGRRAYAIDLPGAGLNVEYPNSYVTQNLDVFSAERSPLAGLGLNNYAEVVVNAIQQLSKNGKVILVGHSFGGLTITKAAEAVPELIQRIVYLTAYCPVLLPSASAYLALPEFASSLSGSALLGDPTQTGALRTNPRSADSAYIEKVRQAFYNDVPTASFLPFANALVPDIPFQVSLDDARGTLGRWGQIPRSFIRCTLDQSIPIAMQDRMIREADASTPGNKFDQHTLESSHSAFASMPESIVTILASFS